MSGRVMNNITNKVKMILVAGLLTLMAAFPPMENRRLRGQRSVALSP